MELNITKLDEKAVVPSIDRNILALKCLDILTEVGKDGTLVLIYRTGISIEIPVGYIGLIVPTRLAPIYSLEDAAGVQILNQGYNGEIIARYKVNTSSVPAIFEKGEEFASLLIMPTVEDLTFNMVELPEGKKGPATAEVTEDDKDPEPVVSVEEEGEV